MLPLPVIESWLNAFNKKNKRSNIIFLGGEPTLHPELSQIVKKAKCMGYESITIDTNGYLFHNILDKLDPDDVDYLSFSLDGKTRQTNDAIRGKGSYDRCIEGIQQAVKKKITASLIFTVSRENIHELSKMGPLIADLGIDRLFIQVIGIRGRSTKSGGDLQLSKKEWLDTVPSAAADIASLGVTVTYPKVFLGPDESFECAARVAENYFIFPNGRVYQCPLCEDYPIHSLQFTKNQLVPTERINEGDLFRLDIPEGCVMNKLIQPDNLVYDDNGVPEYKVACCLLKEELHK
jgi:Fe-coproporphyrin III synthase